MRLGFIAFLLSIASCVPHPSGQPAVLQALEELPGGKTARLYVDANQAPRWVVPLDEDALPSIVRRTAQTVQPDGTLHFVGRVYGGPEGIYIVEKRYPAQGEDHLRRVIISNDGSVILRSHSLPIDRAPDPVAARIAARGDLEALEYVEGEGMNYFRATILEAGAVRRVMSYTAEGDLLWGARLLPVEASISR